MQDENLDLVKVYTIGSAQGYENDCIIFDFVIAKARLGTLGFVTNAGRITVGVSRPRNLQIYIGELNTCDKSQVAIKAEAETLGETAATASSEKTQLNKLEEIFNFVREGKSVMDLDPTETIAKDMVSLADANDTVRQIQGVAERRNRPKRACHLCASTDYMAADCPTPDALKICNNCGETCRKATKCTKSKVEKCTCHVCKQVGHVATGCPERTCARCEGKGHVIADCTGPERRTCSQCKEKVTLPKTTSARSCHSHCCILQRLKRRRKIPTASMRSKMSILTLGTMVFQASQLTTEIRKLGPLQMRALVMCKLMLGIRHVGQATIASEKTGIPRALEEKRVIVIRGSDGATFRESYGYCSYPSFHLCFMKVTDLKNVNHHLR